LVLHVGVEGLPALAGTDKEEEVRTMDLVVDEILEVQLGTPAGDLMP
jgi:hypothetical protein